MGNVDIELMQRLSKEGDGIMLYQAIMKTLSEFGWIAIVGAVASFVCYKADKREKKGRGNK